MGQDADKDNDQKQDQPDQQTQRDQQDQVDQQTQPQQQNPQNAEHGTVADNTRLRGEEVDGQPCPITGSRPHDMPPTFAEGIEGITFTPGSPFAVRGGLQIFF